MHSILYTSVTAVKKKIAQNWLVGKVFWGWADPARVGRGDRGVESRRGQGLIAQGATIDGAISIDLIAAAVVFCDEGGGAAAKSLR